MKGNAPGGGETGGESLASEDDPATERSGRRDSGRHVAGTVIAPPEGTPLLEQEMTNDGKDKMDRAGFGDAQGTRIGKPTPPGEGQTGMGSEAAEGIHAADGDRDESDQSSLEGKSTGRDGQRAGSEPIDSHDREHESGYGGAGGEAKKPS